MAASHLPGRAWLVPCLLLCASEGFGADAAAPGTVPVYVGTYTGPKSKGIYLLRLDLSTGALTSDGVAAEVANPSFLTISPSRRFLYAVGEISNFEGKKAGAVSAFSIDDRTGKLTLLNQQPSGGTGPCHVAVDASGKNVVVANYGSGSVESLPVKDDGRLGEPASVIQHKGTVADPKRQGGPHAHSINFDAAGRYAVAADLGLDKLFVYKVDPAKGTLTPNDPPAADLAPKAGPRHFAFHPNGRFAYVINEINMTVTAFTYDPTMGALTTIQTIPTIPGETQRGYSTAEVQVHPSGKFVYGSNRGHDSIAIFSVDQATGKLTAVGHQPTGGKTPRNFGIDPTGAYLLAANQGSDTIVVFRIDQKTGELKPTGHSISVPSPVCVKVMSVITR